MQFEEKNSMLPLHIISFDTISSTQTWAKAHCHLLPKDSLSCISADEQTQGHGRYGRKWISPKGQNLYLTFYFCLPSSTPNLSSLAQLLCLSLAKVLSTSGLHPRIKWPNDILLSQKKLSGILCETIFQNETVQIFLGIGINVNMRQKNLDTIDQPATSLFVETQKIWDRNLLLSKIQTQFLEDLSTFEKKGFSPFLSLLNSLLAYKKERVTLFDGKNKYTGVLDSIREDGALILFFPDTQEKKSFFSGDLFLA
jgi:BirA family transcriptional regulator, biotin operon repressor / biotin---[acetyl-CoA-carboxylase] ligase